MKPEELEAKAIHLWKKSLTTREAGLIATANVYVAEANELVYEHNLLFPDRAPLGKYGFYSLAKNDNEHKNGK